MTLQNLKQRTANIGLATWRLTCFYETFVPLFVQYSLRTFFNPVINDTATFIETSEETNGKHSLIEIELYKSDGPPLHYHNTFSEKFQVTEGTLYLQVGKERKILKPGNSATVPPGTTQVL